MLAIVDVVATPGDDGGLSTWVTLLLDQIYLSNTEIGENDNAPILGASLALGRVLSFEVDGGLRVTVEKFTVSLVVSKDKSSSSSSSSSTSLSSRESYIDCGECPSSINESVSPESHHI